MTEKKVKFMNYAVVDNREENEVQGHAKVTKPP